MVAVCRNTPDPSDPECGHGNHGNPALPPLFEGLSAGCYLLPPLRHEAAGSAAPGGFPAPRVVAAATVPSPQAGHMAGGGGVAGRGGGGPTVGTRQNVPRADRVAGRVAAGD